MVDGERGVGHAIEREAALVAGGEVGAVGEDGADVLGAAAACEGGFETDFEMDEERSGRGEEEFAGFRALDCAAAESEDEGIGYGEAGDGSVLEIAEGRFAACGEDFCNGEACFGFEDGIGVKKLPAEARGEERADGGFARAHEAGEDDAARREGSRLHGCSSGEKRVVGANPV